MVSLTCDLLEPHSGGAPHVHVFRSSLLGHSNLLEKLLAVSFLVESALATHILKVGWAKKAESISIQYIIFPYFLYGVVPLPSTTQAALQSKDPVLPPPENIPPTSA